jgi:hypothetical protein
MARDPLTYRGARRNIVIREAKMKSEWSRFRFFTKRSDLDMTYIKSFLSGVRRMTLLRARA